MRILTYSTQTALLYWHKWENLALAVWVFLCQSQSKWPLIQLLYRLSKCKTRLSSSSNSVLFTVMDSIAFTGKWVWSQCQRDIYGCCGSCWWPLHHHSICFQTGCNNQFFSLWLDQLKATPHSHETSVVHFGNSNISTSITAKCPGIWWNSSLSAKHFVTELKNK